MNNPQRTTIAAGVLIVAALFTAWRAHESASTAKAARAAVSAESASWAARIRGWEDRQATAEKRRADLAAASAVAKPASGVQAPLAAKISRTPPPSLSEWLDRMDRDPKFQVLHLANERTKLAVSYGPLFHQLGLSRTQIEKLSDLLMGVVANEEDLRAIERKRGLSPVDPALAAFRKVSAVEAQAAERALLGARGFAQLQDYERMLPAWGFVGRMAGTAALAGIPFSPEQATQLVGAMTKAGGAPARDGKVPLTSIDWTKVDTEAAAILSPEQLALFVRADPPGGATRWGMKMISAVLKAGRPSRPPGPNRP